MKYRFEAVTDQGELLEETLVAHSRDEAIKKVERMGYYPTVLSEVLDEQTEDRDSPSKKKITL